MSMELNGAATPRGRVEAIIFDVAARHKVPVAAIMGRRRTLPIMAARHEAVWMVKQATGFSLPHIGRIFDRDHSTIFNSVRRYAEVTSKNWSPPTMAATFNAYGETMREARHASL